MAMRKTKTYISVLKIIYWVKPVVPMLLTSTLLIGGPARRRRLVIFLKRKRFSKILFLFIKN